ncbi:MAG TPA: hypothetical protein VN674_08280 [Gemmatimonadales bacterium]|nr:hypothetical protein [Gemmatimonadales bacterium]
MEVWAGWVATTMTVSSYFFKRPITLRVIQATSACVWLVYGWLIHSGPVLVTNVLVVVAALGSIFFMMKGPGNAPA